MKRRQRVFAEIPFGQAKCRTFSRKFLLGKQNVARFHRNFVWTSKMRHVLAEIPFWQGKRGAFLQKFHLNEQNAARFRENFVWTGKTSHVFAEIPFGQGKRRVEMSAFCVADDFDVPWKSKSTQRTKPVCVFTEMHSANERGQYWRRGFQPLLKMTAGMIAACMVSRASTIVFPKSSATNRPGCFPCRR